MPFSQKPRTMAASLHTHAVKHGYNTWSKAIIYRKRKKKENYFVSHSFPIRLMTTLLCSTALRMESLSLQSHSCKQSIKWEQDEIMCQQASSKQALSQHSHSEVKQQLEWCLWEGLPGCLAQPGVCASSQARLTMKRSCPRSPMGRRYIRSYWSQR